LWGTEGLSNKLIVLMPPTTGRDDRQKTWNDARARLNQHGYLLPEFMADGLIYLASTTLAPLHAYPYVNGGRRALRAALTELLTILPSGEPTAEVMAEINVIERKSKGPQKCNRV
jgi:hypothetical protein